MGDISIRYVGMRKTEAIDSYIREKISPLEKFLADDFKIFLKVVDSTPKKKTRNPDYQITIDIHHLLKGKTAHETITCKDRDLYACIDQISAKGQEKLRRVHDKSTRNFKDFKDKLFMKYSNFNKK